jgi:hypothetical protein
VDLAQVLGLVLDKNDKMVLELGKILDKLLEPGNKRVLELDKVQMLVELGIQNEGVLNGERCHYLYHFHH